MIYLAIFYWIFASLYTIGMVRKEFKSRIRMYVSSFIFGVFMLPLTLGEIVRGLYDYLNENNDERRKNTKG